MAAPAESHGSSPISPGTRRGALEAAAEVAPVPELGEGMLGPENGAIGRKPF